MFDFIMIIILGWFVWWVTDIAVQQDIAQQCLTQQSFKADGKEFACLVQKE